MHSFSKEYEADLPVSSKMVKPPFKPNLLKKSMFIHMPKTGGTFFREHFNEQPDWFNCLGVGHGNMQDFYIFDDYFSFTFIRNPEQWLLSYWNFYRLILQNHEAFDFQKKWSDAAIQRGVIFTRWNQKANPVEVLWHDDLDTFLERIRHHAPNVIDLAYKHFTYRVDFVGKTENIVEDIITALTLAGEDLSFYSPDIIRTWSNDRRNEHPRQPDLLYNKALMGEIMDLNPLICSHY